MFPTSLDTTAQNLQRIEAIILILNLSEITSHSKCSAGVKQNFKLEFQSLTNS